LKGASALMVRRAGCLSGQRRDRLPPLLPIIIILGSKIPGRQIGAYGSGRFGTANSQGPRSSSFRWRPSNCSGGLEGALPAVILSSTWPIRRRPLGRRACPLGASASCRRLSRAISALRATFLLQLNNSLLSIWGPQFAAFIPPYPDLADFPLSGDVSTAEASLVPLLSPLPASELEPMLRDCAGEYRHRSG
jgi:hypothetical protein